MRYREQTLERDEPRRSGGLVVDYTLTVTVSISAGVEALVSAFPSLSGASVPMCLTILAIVAILNLRGVGNAASVCSRPSCSSSVSRRDHRRRPSSTHSQ